MSPKYKLTKENLGPILKVIAWSLGSALVAILTTIVADIEFPPEYAFVVPIINVVLYTAKEFFSKR